MSEAEPKDIEVKVWGMDGMPMTMTVPWDADIDDWENYFKTILTFLRFGVDKLVINPESDDPQAREDTIND